VADSDGNVADDPSASFQIAIVDDVPTAVADTDSVTEGGTASGNVITDAAPGDFGDTDTGADTKGADGASVTGVTGFGATTPAGSDFHVVGQYGILTLSPDGTYSYIANSNISNVSAVTETFTYTLKDGDGDTSQTTLTITINDGTNPSVVTNAVIAVDEEGLGTANATGSAAATNVENGSGTVSFHAGSDNITGVAFTSVAGITANVNGVVGADIVWTLVGPTQITGSINGIDAIHIDLVAPSLPILAGANGSATVNVTLLDNFPHPDAGGQNVINLTGINVVATDTDGDQASATVQVNVTDDVPTLGTVQSQQASNDPLQAPAVGTLHFVAGADGAGAGMTITVDTTGLTSAGHHLVTAQVGNVLTAYADNNNSGTHDAGDTAVFTITVDPTAGTSGQYTFDLLAPLDGTTTNVAIGQGSSFGSGPSSSVVVHDNASNQDIVMVTGWKPTGGFTGTEETDWYSQTGIGADPTLTQQSNINGSTQGWGLGNNNLNQGEFLRFDFGTPNDYDSAGSYVAPNIALTNVSYATFTFFSYDVGDKIEFVAHYTDGTSAHYTPPAGAASLTITSPSGTQIAWIDAYESSGTIKLNLTNVGVTSTTVDHTIAATVQLTDGDGDQTLAGSFTVHVKDGLTPNAVAAPVLLDLNHDGIHTTDLTHSTVSFDYNGDGVASKTAWVDTHDGILAIDLNGDGKVNNGSEIVFTQQAAGAATDLAALALVYDTNHDGKLTAADHDFGQFGVWQDANGNGVSDSGEFKSLAALGIVEIGLTSDNQHSVSEDGSVLTYGGSTFTTASGETGAVADIGFGNFDTTGQTGTTGADTFKLDNLDIKDLITDYHGTGPGGEGDKIDLSALFDTASGGNINDYVHYDADTKTLSVDTTGSGNAANFVDVAALQNAPAAGTITILYDDTAHVQHTATI
ncbi:type I secretion C-terminal target domain-containing protein, partial [Mesorhizobium sp. M7A.F.Ca.US.010.02.1.1]|uniref:beta strand repeat-containing protein n=1 Tax=Mesorhizobium sp. M7A.F.Ca.US.010.02.1.1 TaxID=2496743 RepID=UPI000FD352B9